MHNWTKVPPHIPYMPSVYNHHPRLTNPWYYTPLIPNIVRQTVRSFYTNNARSGSRHYPTYQPLVYPLILRQWRRRYCCKHSHRKFLYHHMLSTMSGHPNRTLYTFQNDNHNWNPAPGHIHFRHPPPTHPQTKNRMALPHISYTGWHHPWHMYPTNTPHMSIRPWPL